MKAASLGILAALIVLLAVLLARGWPRQAPLAASRETRARV